MYIIDCVQLLIAFPSALCQQLLLLTAQLHLGSLEETAQLLLQPVLLGTGADLTAVQWSTFSTKSK